MLSKPDGGAIFFSGEALYAGPDMGTVEAALASGLETAQTILTGSSATPFRARKARTHPAAAWARMTPSSTPASRPRR